MKEEIQYEAKSYNSAVIEHALLLLQSQKYDNETYRSGVSVEVDLLFHGQNIQKSILEASINFDHELEADVISITLLSSTGDLLAKRQAAILVREDKQFYEVGPSDQFTSDQYQGLGFGGALLKNFDVLISEYFRVMKLDEVPIIIATIHDQAKVAGNSTKQRNGWTTNMGSAFGFSNDVSIKERYHQKAGNPLVLLKVLRDTTRNIRLI